MEILFKQIRWQFLLNRTERVFNTKLARSYHENKAETKYISIFVKEYIRQDIYF